MIEFPVKRGQSTSTTNKRVALCGKAGIGEWAIIAAGSGCQEPLTGSKISLPIQKELK